MAASRSSTEPSMEEILASIRRIISEEGPNPPSDMRGPALATPAVTAPDQGGGKSPVLDLTEMVDENSQALATPAPVAEESLPAPKAAAAEPAPAPPISAPLIKAPREKLEAEAAAGAILRKALPTPSVPQEPSPDQMVSPRAQAQAQQALAELRRAAEVERAKAMENKRDTLGLEGLVLEALKPQLKAWLDQNLGPLVERVVREEVRRLVKQQTQA